MTHALYHSGWSSKVMIGDDCTYVDWLWWVQHCHWTRTWSSSIHTTEPRSRLVRCVGVQISARRSRDSEVPGASVRSSAACLLSCLCHVVWATDTMLNKDTQMHTNVILLSHSRSSKEEWISSIAERLSDFQESICSVKLMTSRLYRMFKASSGTYVIILLICVIFCFVISSCWADPWFCSEIIRKRIIIAW